MDRIVTDGNTMQLADRRVEFWSEIEFTDTFQDTEFNSVPGEKTSPLEGDSKSQNANTRLHSESPFFRSASVSLLRQVCHRWGQDIFSANFHQDEQKAWLYGMGGFIVG